jgi:hypothetical protein
VRGGVYFFPWALGGDFTLLESQAWASTPSVREMERREEERVIGGPTKPSNNPSPVVAQLGTTNQILSFSWLSLRASVTSAGFMAMIQLVSTISADAMGRGWRRRVAYLLGYLACWQIPVAATPSFLGR